MQAFSSGLALGFGLIAAIGAQNAFVLRQGLQRNHVFAICMTCASSDAILVYAGTAGFGALVTSMPWLEALMTVGGAAFLLTYAIKSFRTAINTVQILAPSNSGSTSLKSSIATCLAFTWLNPHVYLDTVVLLGSISANYGAERFHFGAGAITASFVFFFALGYGARLLAPVFANPRAWRVLDFLIGLVMSALAVKLLLSVFP